MKSQTSDSRGWLLAALVAAAWVTLIWFVHWESPRTLVSFHGFIHAAIAERFLETSTVSFPPENPFFAGQPLAYYWFFHFVAARLAELFGCNIFYAFELLILAAAVVLVVSALRLGRAIYQSAAAGLLMSFLVFAGTNPLGALYAGARIALRGRAALVDDPNYLWGVVGPLHALIRFRDQGGLYGPLLNFFLNLTSRPLALAALMLQLACLAWVLRRRNRVSLLMLALTSALTAALSPIVGIAVGGVLFAGFAGAWLWERRRPQEARAQFRIVPFALGAIAVGILLAAPTYLHLLTGPSDRGLGLWLLEEDGLSHILTLILSVFPLACLAWVGLRRFSIEWRPFGVSFFIAAILLLLACAALVFPSSNESNFFHAAVVFLAVPAAGVVFRTAPEEFPTALSRKRVAALLLVFLPAPLVMLGGYLNRPSIAVSFTKVIPARLPADSDLAALYNWVRTATSRDAVFIIDPRPPRVTAGGNMSEFPAMTNRVIFTEHFNHYLVRPYADSKTRFDLAVRIHSGEAPTDADRSYLRNLARPIFVVSYRGQDPDWLPHAERHFGAPVFQRNTAVVFRWTD